MSRAAGWYRDPEHADALRWWDGSAWTQHRAPPPPLPPGPLGITRPVGLRHRRRGWVLTFLALAVLATLVVTGAASLVAGDPGSEASRSDTTAPTPADPTGAPAPGPSRTDAPDPAAPAPHAPKASTATRRARRAHPSRPGPGTALAVLADLPVKSRAARTGYTRHEFGQAWL